MTVSGPIPPEVAHIELLNDLDLTGNAIECEEPCSSWGGQSVCGVRERSRYIQAVSSMVSMSPPPPPTNAAVPGS